MVSSLLVLLAMGSDALGIKLERDDPVLMPLSCVAPFCGGLLSDSSLSCLALCSSFLVSASGTKISVSIVVLRLITS